MNEEVPIAECRPSRRGPWSRLRRAAQRGLVVAGMGAAAAVACEHTVVTTLPVTNVAVIPDSADLLVGETVALSAELRGEDGVALVGRVVTWSTSSADVATVDDAGVVLGVGPGASRITGSVEGQEASATIVVLRPPTIRLEADSAVFDLAPGQSDPATVEIRIGNGGDAPLTQLTTDIAYDGASRDWLVAQLASSTAPTTLTITVHTAALEAGRHTATVTVSAPGTAVPPAVIAVAVRVEQQAPAAPGGRGCGRRSGARPPRTARASPPPPRPHAPPRRAGAAGGG